MTDAIYNYDLISKYVIAYCNKNEKTITNLVLQKTLYYIQGYFLRIFDFPAFNSSINKWPYGPVVPDAYYEYYTNGAKPIYVDEEYREKYINAIKEKSHIKLLNSIINACLTLSIGDLIEKTHQEQPWSISKMRHEITIDLIIKFFNDNNPLGINQ